MDELEKAKGPIQGKRFFESYVSGNDPTTTYLDDLWGSEVGSRGVNAAVGSSDAHAVFFDDRSARRAVFGYFHVRKGGVSATEVCTAYGADEEGKRSGGGLTRVTEM